MYIKRLDYTATKTPIIVGIATQPQTVKQILQTKLKTEVLKSVYIYVERTNRPYK